jgi:hypothetical protein
MPVSNGVNTKYLKNRPAKRAGASEELLHGMEDLLYRTTPPMIVEVLTDEMWRAARTDAQPDVISISTLMSRQVYHRSIASSG